ncbi:MAG: dihydrolipoyl dehydrogenase [Parachlamydiaceae bacterium]|nr:dihydrolipoyl dehydrogenase [Parachlamydiaceae bacterium]
MSEQYDLAVIGSGPGGYVAAIRAAQLGFKTVCIDKRGTFGGTCLNVGCIPSKALLQATEMFAHLNHQAKDFGIEITNASMNFSKMMERKNQVVKTLTDGIAGLFRRHGVHVLNGEAQFLDPHRLKITQSESTVEIQAKYILIATGSESIELPHLPFDEKKIISSTGALSLLECPKELLVIGGGVIGVELASVYQRLGAKVPIIDMMDRLGPGLDLALSKQLLQSLKKQGIDCWLSSKVVSADLKSKDAVLSIEQNGQTIQKNGDIVLVAVGRRPFTKGLQLEKVGIQLDAKGFIIVDQNFRTSQKHVFAIGDTIEGVMLAHRASAEGVAIVEALKGGNPIVNYLAIPNVVYTNPEVASVGLTEEECQQDQMEIIVGTSFFRGNPRARCMDETEGFVKIIGDKHTGRLIGMHIIGPHASELISEGMLAIQNKALVEDLAEAPQAHPTLSEAIKEAALEALGRAIHH